MYLNDLIITPLHEIIAYIFFHCVFKRIERLMVACLVQFSHIGLGKVLILVANVYGGIYVLYMDGKVKSMENGFYEIVKRAGFAGAGIVQAVCRLVLHKPHAYMRYVFYINKVSYLLTVFVGRVVRAEEFHGAFFLYLVEGVKDHRGHAGFMVFIGAEYVEKT